MTERNREQVTPDQNPHPLTDHDGHAPQGETPMPLVDGVALRGPGPATPPPLFRPREEADCEPVGVEVYSAQPTGIEYAPEVAAAMQRRRIAAIDAKHRDSVLTSVVDAVDDTVNRLTTRGIVDLDDYERKALVKDLTVAFYTGRSGTGDGA
ncbi:hypothetical protein SMICM17S_03178 [Streptomyces microflavus]